MEPNHTIPVDELKNIKTELSDVKQSILTLNATIEKLVKSCSRMDSHIDFVEATYDNLKHPLNYITQKIGNMIGGERELE